MPDLVTVEQIQAASRELQDAWDRRDWSELMTREKSVRSLAEGAFTQDLPEGDLRQEMFNLQRQYLQIVAEIKDERDQLKDQLAKSGNRLRAVQHYRATDKMKKR